MILPELGVRQISCSVRVHLFNLFKNICDLSFFSSYLGLPLNAVHFLYDEEWLGNHSTS